MQKCLYQYYVYDSTITRLENRQFENWFKRNNIIDNLFPLTTIVTLDIHMFHIAKLKAVT